MIGNYLMINVLRRQRRLAGFCAAPECASAFGVMDESDGARKTVVIGRAYIECEDYILHCARLGDAPGWPGGVVFHHYSHHHHHHHQKRATNAATIAIRAAVASELASGHVKISSAYSILCERARVWDRVPQSLPRCPPPSLSLSPVAPIVRTFHNMDTHAIKTRQRCAATRSMRH